RRITSLLIRDLWYGRISARATTQASRNSVRRRVMAETVAPPASSLPDTEPRRGNTLWHSRSSSSSPLKAWQLPAGHPASGTDKRAPGRRTSHSAPRVLPSDGPSRLVAHPGGLRPSVLRPSVLRPRVLHQSGLHPAPRRF